LQFLDQMLRDKDKNLRFEEITIPIQSSYVGKPLRDVPFRSEANVLVVAVREESAAFVYNPGPEHRLRAGAVLVVLGETQSVHRLHDLMDRSLRA
jgi:voltage-gated potassium channel